MQLVSDIKEYCESEKMDCIAFQCSRIMHAMSHRVKEIWKVEIAHRKFLNMSEKIQSQVNLERAFSSCKYTVAKHGLMQQWMQTETYVKWMHFKFIYENLNITMNSRNNVKSITMSSNGGPLDNYETLFWMHIYTMKQWQHKIYDPVWDYKQLNQKMIKGKEK